MGAASMGTVEPHSIDTVPCMPRPCCGHGELDLHISKRMSHMKAAGTYLGKQPRGHRMANAIPEYQCINWIQICDMPVLDRKGRVAESVSDVAQGSKCVYVTDVNGATWRLCDVVCIHFVDFPSVMGVPLYDLLQRRLDAKVGDATTLRSTSASDGVAVHVTPLSWVGFGKFRTPQEWHLEAEMLKFPADTIAFVRPWQARTLTTMFTSSPEALAQLRARALGELVSVAKRLDGQERSLHTSLHDHARTILHGKRLLLLKEVLDDVGLKGAELVAGIQNGFDITGDTFSVDMFEDIGDRYKPATLSREQLLQEACWRKDRVKVLTRSSGDVGFDELLYDSTLQESQSGSLLGPYTEVELDELFGCGQWVPARRFGIMQSSGGMQKLRPIDDFSFNYQNSTAQVLERLNHGGVDEVIALILVVQRGLHDGFFDFMDTDEVHHRFPVHDSWRSTSRQVVGRTLDLQRAYKQLPVSSRDLRFAVTTVFRPQDGCCHLLALCCAAFRFHK